MTAPHALLRLVPLLAPLLLASCAYVSAADQEARLAEFDDDGDGFADLQAGGTDCDDTNADVFPGAEELCNGLDDDCDGVDDDGLLVLRYLDGDGDGVGAPDGGSLACPDEPGFSSSGMDCDDEDPDVFPDAPERCNGLDDDCDRRVDEDAGQDWFADRDGDGHGDPAHVQRACDAPAGFVDSDDDCNDAEPTAFPGGEEICDELDNDCNGTIDDGTATEVVWFADADGDGFGNPEVSEVGCVITAGWVIDNRDCDDTAADIHPNAIEPSCDGIDHNCDGDPDDPTRRLECE